MVLLLWIILLVRFHICLYYAVLSVSCSFVITCWERDNLFALFCVVCCHFPRCVLIQIRIKGGDCTVKMFKPPVFFVLIIPRQCFSCGSSLLFMFLVGCCYIFCLFLATLWSPAGKGLASWLTVCDVFLCFCHFFFMVSQVSCGTSWSLTSSLLFQRFFCIYRPNHHKYWLWNALLQKSFQSKEEGKAQIDTIKYHTWPTTLYGKETKTQEIKEVSPFQIGDHKAAKQTWQYGKDKHK